MTVAGNKDMTDDRRPVGREHGGHAGHALVADQRDRQPTVRAGVDALADHPLLRKDDMDVIDPHAEGQNDWGELRGYPPPCPHDLSVSRRKFGRREENMVWSLPSNKLHVNPQVPFPGRGPRRSRILFPIRKQIVKKRISHDRDMDLLIDVNLSHIIAALRPKSAKPPVSGRCPQAAMEIVLVEPGDLHQSKRVHDQQAAPPERHGPVETQLP